MAHLVLQDVDPRVIESLSASAGRHGRSVEEEARAVLEGALGISRERALEGARRLREQWRAGGRPLTPSGELLALDGDRFAAGAGGSSGAASSESAAEAKRADGEGRSGGAGRSEGEEGKDRW